MSHFTCAGWHFLKIIWISNHRRVPALPNATTRSSGAGYCRRCAPMTAWRSLAKTAPLTTFPTGSWITSSWTTGTESSTATFPRYTHTHTHTHTTTMNIESTSTRAPPPRWRAVTGSASWSCWVKACCGTASPRGTRWPSPGTWSTTAACTSPSTSSGSATASLRGTSWRFVQILRRVSSVCLSVERSL